jgi:hypothetical protein
MAAIGGKHLSDEPEVTKLKVSLGQMVVVVVFVVGLGISWGASQTALQTNREIMARIDESLKNIERELTNIRERQIVNEQIVDHQAGSIYVIEERLRIPHAEVKR